MDARWCFAALLTMMPLFADTVYLKDGGSVNGDIKSMQNGEVALQARFRTGDPKLLPIKLADIKRIAFNTKTLNDGSPRKEIAIGPPDKNSEVSSLPSTPRPNPPDKTGPAMDTVTLQGGQSKPCDLTSIDGQSVHCAGKSGDYPRASVLEIQVRSR